MKQGIWIGLVKPTFPSHRLLDQHTTTCLVNAIRRYGR